MEFFIILTVAYITGMSVAAVMEVQTGGLFLLLGGFLLLGALIPFWTKHAYRIQEGQWGQIWEDEEMVPFLSMLLIISGFFFLGLFRYVYALYPIPPKHISRLMAEDPRAKWRLVGKIIEEPNLKNDYLEVVIEPETVQELPRGFIQKSKKKAKKSGKGKKGKAGASEIEDTAAQTASSSAEEPPQEDEPPIVEVEGGLVLAQVFQENEAFNMVKYNQRIELGGRFSAPSARRNPGSLDYQKSLIDRGIYRTFRLASPKDGSLRILSEGDTGNLWYRFALYLRTEFLKVTKQTMPFPESSFLGGVFLGLKGGLPPIVTTEFRKTGVSHVLAVSGLHVTIIAGLFYGLFTVFRVPLRVFAPIIVFFLFTFALIVGWPSSAVRAAMMNSLFVISRAYLKDLGFRQSIIFALSVAAFYILTMSPLQLNEPSFTLSFMAIYALAMFSGPSEKLLRESLRGPGLLFAASAVLLFYFVVSVKRDLILADHFFFWAFLFSVGVFYVSKKLSEKSGFQSFSFEALPQWLASFIASQMGIFLGMMGPLSSFYFGSMSLSAPIANLIAIPLIGVIVQLGMIAGIIGTFVPFVGLHLALLINAANWLGVKFFLGMAHFFAVLIPFPRVSQPGFGAVLLYYLVLHLFFFWDVIRDYALAIGSAVADIWEDPDYKISLSLVGGLLIGVLFYLGIYSLSRVQFAPKLRVTMLDVGYGASVLVEKGGKTLLVDAGMRDELSGYDIGERVILPAFSEKHLKHVDAVILTTCLPEQVSGIFNVVENYRVERLYIPFDLPTDGNIVSFPDFLAKISLDDRKLDDGLKNGIIPPSPPSFYWEQAYSAYNNLIRTVFKKKIEVVPIQDGQKIEGFEELVTVINPNEKNARFNAYYDAPFLVFSEGSRKIGYANGNVFRWEKVFSDQLDLLLVSCLPYSWDKFERFLESNKPKHVALSFRKPSGWLMEKFYMGKILDGRILQFNRKGRMGGLSLFRTDRNGAIQADFFRDQLNLKTYIENES